MTAPGMKERLDAIRARGGRLVVVDPRRSETADRADEHVFIRPGADAAFLLGMLHTLFEEQLVDPGHAGPWLDGQGDVHKLVARYAPERVGAACGIDPHAIRRLAREFAAAGAAIAYGRMGTCVQRFGTLASWAIDLLNILTGNLDRPGGVMFPNPAVNLGFAGPWAREETPYGRYQSRVGGHDEIQGEFPMAAFAEEIETEGDGQIRALAIIAGNPVASAPNAARIDRALESLEFMVAFDYYINETTRHADLILPPTPPLSHATYDVALLHFAVRNVAKWSPAAVEPEPESRPVWRVLLELSKRLMGLEALASEQVDTIVLQQFAALALPSSRFAGELEPEQIVAALGDEPGPRRVIDLLLRLGAWGDGFGRDPDGLTLAKLETSVHGIDLGPLEPSLPESLKTLSGRLPLAPERIVADLPRLDAWLVETETDDRLLLIGRRDVRSMNSWLHNLPSLAKGRDRCTLQVNPKDADALGLVEGGRVELSGRVGRLLAPVEVTDRMAPGVVSLPHGFGHDLPGVELEVASRKPGVNTNLVVDDTDLDAPTGSSILNGVPVQITSVPGL